MYDKLVKALREAHEHAMEWERNPFRYAALYKVAADAIEELAGFLQEAERDRDEYRERLDKANDAIEELQKRVSKRPHGRLIDADALEDELGRFCDDNWVYNTLHHAPTIILAEGGET